MSLDKTLQNRSNQQCELCGNTENLKPFLVEPQQSDDANDHILLCETCRGQIENPDTIQANHWRCLNDSMWSEIPAVQVMAWRMLHRLRNEGWPQDLLDMLYLDEETLEWAKATGEDKDPSEIIVHKDSNGAVLESGDSVVLIKDLKVKGTSFIAKRGTAVRRISLAHDNPEHIEGKVEGTQIVILTKFVKKI
jgi:protein PhnA